MNSKAVYWLGAGFLIFAPLSVASDLEAAGPAKYVRLAITGLIVLAALTSNSLSRARSASLSFLPFVAFWAVSPCWSTSPLWGLFFKGMFVLTFLSGIALALAPRTIPELESGLRLLGAVASVAAVVVLFAYVTNPEGSVTHGRMSVGGLNANMVAQTAAPLAIFSAFLGLYSSRRHFRKLAACGFSLLLMILLLTGSRGGIMMAAIGCGILVIPVARRPGVLLLIFGLVFGCGYIAFEVLSVSDEVRVLSELTKDTRSSVWASALRRFESSPLIGQGWLVQRGRASWATVQGAYIQVLAETGLVGLALLLTGMLTTGVRLLGVRRSTRNSVTVQRVWFLSAACLAASSFHGLAESSLVVGTSLTPLLLGFGAGLVDRIPALARQGADGGGLQWQWVWIPSEPSASTAPEVAAGALRG